MSMWAVIGIMVVIFIVGYLISMFTDAVMTDDQKKDDTPVFYKDENGVPKFKGMDNVRVTVSHDNGVAVAFVVIE